MQILCLIVFILVVSTFAQVMGEKKEPCKGHKWVYDSEGHMKCKECGVRAGSL